MEPPETLCAFNPAGDQTSAGPDHVSRRAIKPKLEDGTSRAVGWAADENLLQAGGDDGSLIPPWTGREPALGRAGRTWLYFQGAL